MSLPAGRLMGETQPLIDGNPQISIERLENAHIF